MAMILRSKRAKPLVNSTASSSSQTSSANINDLPCEMLLQVFGYLDKGQLLNTIPQVCTRWETLHRDHSLYSRRIIFTKQWQSTDDAIKLLSNTAKWLKSLQLQSRNDTNVILECVSQSNQRLETLILQDCQGSSSRKPVSSVSLRRVLNKCNLLQHLSLEGSHCQSRPFYNEIGLRLPSLRSVNLGTPTSFDFQALLNIADNCLQLEEIRAFELYRIIWDNAPITDIIVSRLCNQLQYLKSVEIDFHKCTDSSMIALAKCQQLTNLKLMNAIQITNIGIMSISNMPNIVNLELFYNHRISTSCWSDFFRKPIMRRLQKLKLYNCMNLTKAHENMIVGNPFDLRELHLYNGIYFQCNNTFPQS